MKPAVGGMPVNEIMKSSMSSAAHLLRRASPVKSSISSPSNPPLRSIVTTVKAPSVIKA